MELKIYIQDQKTIEYHLKDGELSVGRSLKCDIHIPHESVSRKHLTMRIQKGKIHIIDHGGVNGTRIDGEKLKPDIPHEWPTFFPLKIGKKIEIQFNRENTVIRNLEDFELKKKVIEKKTAAQKKFNHQETKKKQPVILKTLIFFIIIITIGYIGYRDFSSSKTTKTRPLKITTSSMTVKHETISTSLLEMIEALNKKNLCTQKTNEICEFAKLNLKESEGAIIHGDELFLFYNIKERMLTTRLKKSFLEESDSNNQRLKILTHTAFIFLFNKLKKLKVKKYNIINTGPRYKVINALVFENDIFKKYRLRDFEIVFEELKNNKKEMFHQHVIKNVKFYL